MSTTITRDDWLKALHDVTVVVNDREALTVNEFAELYQMTRHMAYQQLRSLLEQGRVAETTKRNERGTILKAYRLIPEASHATSAPRSRQRRKPRLK